MGTQNNNIFVRIKDLTSQLRSIFLGTFFYLLYHQLSWTYDTVASIVSLGAWKTWVMAASSYINGPRVLEIGFGPGYLQIDLQHKGISVFGVDESDQMGRMARKRILRAGLRSNLVRGYAQKLPFCTGSFHQVVMTFPSEFIYSASTFAEIHRILVAEGIVVIIPLAWVTGRSLLERTVGWFNHITGEAPVWDENYLGMFTSPEFETHRDMLEFPSSKILLIRLRKKEISPE